MCRVESASSRCERRFNSRRGEHGQRVTGYVLLLPLSGVYTTSRCSLAAALGEEQRELDTARGARGGEVAHDGSWPWCPFVADHGSFVSKRGC
jgi:hypothetical protein